MSVTKPGFHIGSSFRVAWSPDSTRLVTLGRRVAVWDVQARKKIGDVKPFSYESSVAVSPRGDRFAVKNTQGTVAVVDLASVLVRLVLPGDAYGEGAGVRFSGDGEALVDGSWNGDLLVRDATTGAILHHERGPGIGAIESVDGGDTWVYDTGGALHVRRWPFERNDAEIHAYAGHKLWDLAPYDSERVAVGTTGSVELWQLAGRRPKVLARWPTAISGTGEHVAWSPDGRFLAHAGAHYATVLDDQLRVVWHAPFDYASDVAFSPDGRLLAVGDWSKGVVVPLHEILN